MAERLLGYLEQAGLAISVTAVTVIVGGFALAAWRYAFRFRSLRPELNFKRFKVELGRALTLGLEILVLGDVIETITAKPTLQSMAGLAFLVVVRTIVSWTVTLEIEGRWPWQEPVEEPQHA